MLNYSRSGDLRSDDVRCASVHIQAPSDILIVRQPVFDRSPYVASKHTGA